MTDPRRDIPSVSRLLETPAVRALLDQHPRRVVVDAVRGVVDAARAEGSPARSAAEWADTIALAVTKSSRPSLRKVINATGVILHTNLGRAPLADAALDAIRAVADGYSNLEYDIDTGRRGSRYSHCVSLLRELTGAEDALVVNNCAAALVLTLHALARRKEVIVSRGELVEIGGSFRIPDIMSASGARLVEVGTTNRTHDDDYRRAITPRTGAIVKVHRSNFSIEGFTSDVAVDRLAFIAAEHGLPVIHDLGSGLLLSLERYGLRGEPTAADALSAGATLVLMSGDKVLGGPQAGIILGAASAVTRLRRNPLLRAMRIDKLTIAALEATLRLYLEPERALREIPLLAMLTAAPETIRDRAMKLSATLHGRGLTSRVRETVASVGGGAFPTATLPSTAVALAGNAALLEEKLRLAEPAVIARVADGELLVDLRSVAERDDVSLGKAILSALS